MTKPFELQLTADETAKIKEPAGSGGHQSLQQSLIEMIDANDGKVTLNDEELGRLIRYMTQYGSGGFQGRLNAAFKRSLGDLLGW